MADAKLDINKIRARREDMGLSQQQAAELAGLGTRQRWNDIESGRRTNLELETINRIARALKLSARDLLK